MIFMALFIFYNNVFIKMQSTFKMLAGQNSIFTKSLSKNNITNSIEEKITTQTV